MNTLSVFRISSPLLLLFITFFSYSSLSAQGFEGYYQNPTLHNTTIVFAAEGDLWTVPLNGGLAQRLTTHQEEENFPSISPDGKTIAFSASYEGPVEVYTMPISGGLPIRWTYERDVSITNSWTPDGKIIYNTRAYSKVPDNQIITIDLATKEKTRIPLAQASEASYDSTGKTVYFVRPAYHRNVTKRYKGGTARQIWKFTQGADEAIKLTKDYLGGSHHPMWFSGRVYFISDRDGIMNIWSINENGEDLKQHTTHKEFDVRSASVSKGIIVYQMAADLWQHNLASNASKKINIKLVSDLDQLREKWDDNPVQYITSVHPDADGERIVITARGKVFVAPVKSGRFVSFADKAAVRFRDAVFSHDGSTIYTLSDESGEFEFMSMPSNGQGAEKRLTRNGDLLRYGGEPSSDGKWIAYDDLESNMYVLEIATGVSKKISTNQEGIRDFAWSPDNKWLAFVQSALNTMTQIKIYNVDTGVSFDLTTDRANSFNPRWSPDGEFIYFLSDRSFTSLVGSPWGARQPEPYFDASEIIYHVALKSGTRSPFREDDELFDENKKKDTSSKTDQKKKNESEENIAELVVSIDEAGIQERIIEVPIKPGNYDGLEVNKKALYVMSSETGVNAKSHLSFVKIDTKDISLKTMVSDVNSFEITGNGEKILVKKEQSYYMIHAGTEKVSDLSKSKINLSGWKFPITPKDDWKQIFTDAWRMERDYFYDKNMHGVDWDAMHTKYLPLVDRVTTRNELSDLIGRFVGELSALHTSVRGGDRRDDDNKISIASLGAVFNRDVQNNGFKIEYIYKVDPDYPDQKSPLDDPYLEMRAGDIITQVNGKDALSAIDIGALIRNETGKQVRLTVLRGSASRDIIVKPVANDYNLRYGDWEYGNRLDVEKKGENEIGYLHLRAMGSNDISQFYREFYPVFNKSGLIVDVRYNFGGNIDSFILEKLLRKAWMYWKSRSGEPYWNMPYAFRGHIVVLVNENTYSDGEAFADGFKKLKLGTTIGTRTWGGEIWLNSANRLSDNGIARAPMYGVYGDNGEWLIEGHGFEPDIEVDNLPHATFNGQDAQLDAAIKYLKQLIKEDPREVPVPPAYPDKSFNTNKKKKD
ncbi:tricorn protease [Psychroflexus torquis ATCC 700755]|uniref:Tricorn protease homolog n=1 Tax=Psychroflexus torquis (strain ATCC 700755 / CIP 106069 / ACAM 623) TaxID=313595 RepID=K4IAP2_PSYTT|nr:S41 family peptidase [Psychroflexus torquis]AFU67687.1 tricorn protease [Psychroflexus torquis ATCC 700755]